MASVYMHTVKENGKRYVGQCKGSPESRWGAHGHRYKGQFFYNAIAKYGWDGMTHEVVATDLSQNEADILERELIAKYKTNERKYGYNLAVGGKDGSGSPGGKNPNARAVMCIETGETWECANYCAIALHVNCASLQESLYHGYRCKGKHYKYVDDNNYVANKLPNRVICLETGQIWNTVRECADDLGVNKRNIVRYCNGSRKAKSGLTYKYLIA